MNAITSANTLEEVIEAINLSDMGQGVPYYGGTDLRESYELAGQYASDASEEHREYDADFADSVNAQLDLLEEEGARFDRKKAFNYATRGLGKTVEES